MTRPLAEPTSTRTQAKHGYGIGQLQRRPDAGGGGGCDEGPWHYVDRVWTIRTDGSGLRLMHKRTVEMEIAGHEFFSGDGRMDTCTRMGTGWKRRMLCFICGWPDSHQR